MSEILCRPVTQFGSDKQIRVSSQQYHAPQAIYLVPKAPIPVQGSRTSHRLISNMLLKGRSLQRAAASAGARRLQGVHMVLMSTLQGSLAGKKVMAANRGEIALRIMRAATELGAGTVGGWAEFDAMKIPLLPHESMCCNGCRDLFKGGPVHDPSLQGRRKLLGECAERVSV